MKLKRRHLTLSKKNLIFAVQIANVTLNSHLQSHFAEIFVLILEYAQLLSQGILLYPILYSEKDNEYEDYPLIRGVFYAAKLVNPSYLLSFYEEKGLTERVLGIILGFFIIKQGVSVYVLCRVFLNKKVNPTLLQILRWIYQTQSRVVYYFITSFFVRSILAYKEFGFTFLGIGKTGDMIIWIFVLGVELMLGLVPKARLYYALPTKSILASKDNTVEVITFVQKFVIQIFQIVLSESSLATRWILTSLNLAFTVLRTFHYFAGLPLYNINGLLIQGSLVGIAASFHLSAFMNLILISRGIVSESLKFLLLSWIMLSLLSVKLSNSLIKKLIFRVLTENNSSVHKIEIIKQFLKRQKLPQKSADHNDWFYLFMSGISKDLERADEKVDFTEKSKMTRFFATYLEKLLVQRPTDEFLKLYLAFYYAKKMQNFAKAIVLILELQKDMGSRLFLNASFLLEEIQVSLKSNYVTRKNIFDLYTYNQSQMKIGKLKLLMTKQIDLQSLVCEELLNHNPDLNKIFLDAQAASRDKQRVMRRMKKMMNIIPQYHTSPLMLCAYYNLIVNQSLVDYRKLSEIYQIRCQKYQKYFSKEVLCEENIYQDNCALLVVSALKSEAGKVIHCGPSVKKVYGGDPEWYIGSRVYDRICSPSLKPVTENLYRFLAEPEGNALLNQVIRTFVFNKEGFLFEADAHLNTFPSVAHGYLIALLLRPKPDNRDFILVRENGEIEGASRKICKRLGIFQPETHGNKRFNINQICGELGRVNNAMSIISSIDKDKIKYDVSITVKRQEEGNNAAVGQNFETLFIGEARDLYNLYTENGNHIAVQPFAKRTLKNFSYRYFCKVSHMVVDSCCLRIFNLQEIENGYQSEISDGLEENHETTNAQEWDVEHEDTSKGLEKKQKTEGENAKLIIQRQSTERDALVTVPVKIAVSVANSTSSINSNVMGVFEMMKLALETKHNSKSWKWIFFFSLSLLIFIIIIVVALFTSLDDTIQSMRFKQDIMSYSQTRGFYTVNLQTSVRSLYDVVAGNIAISDMRRVGLPLPRFVILARNNLEAMALSNKNLSKSVDLLNKTAKEEFYAKNVEIVYPDSNQVMNGFQAIESLVQSGLKILELAQTTHNIPQELFDSLNVNLMNDVLVKNDLISQLTIESVQNEVTSMQSINQRYYIVISITISILACFLCFVIWFQYKGERDNLTQLIRLNHSGIQSILEQYRSFKLNLRKNDQMLMLTNISGTGEVFLGVRQTNKSYSSSGNTSKLQKRFLLYGVKGMALSLALLGALVLCMAFIPDSIDYLNKKLTQMTFMNQIANRVSFLTTAMIELPISRGTANLWDLPILSATDQMITLLAGDRKELMTSFLSEDLLENKEVSQLLFVNACKSMDQIVQLYCNILSNNAVNSSLTQLLGAFETLLVERMIDYERTDKLSAAALKANRLFKFELLISMKRVLIQTPLLVSQFLNEAYESKLKALNERKVAGLYGGLGSSLVIFVILLILVMRPIRESDNNFKKILQIIPAKIILSNFPLKMFLLRTSSIDINLKKYFD